MKRLLVIALVAAAALIVLRHPAPSPAIASVGSVKPGAAHYARKAQSAPAAASALVYVVGAVAHSGLYRVPANARVNDAIERAGGLRADADPAAVNLAERISDGEEIRVPRAGEAAPAVKRSKRKTGKTRAAAAAPMQPLDLNAADANELASIPGIGPTLASRIVAFRLVNGPFASLDELADVAGMTQRRIDVLSAYVTVGS